MDTHRISLRTLFTIAQRATSADARRFHAQLATDHLAGDTSFVVNLGGGGFANVPTAALAALAEAGAINYVDAAGPWGVFELMDTGWRAGG